MFSKISRYRKLPDVVTTDDKGRTLESKTLRLLPGVSSAFIHTIEEVDRLDHLAYKYYRQPRKWWRICDANPEYMFPQALLGKDSIKTAILKIEWDGPDLSWSGLLNELSRMVGIEVAALGTPDQPYPGLQILASTLRFSLDAGLIDDLNASVLTQELSADLRQAFEDEAITLYSEVRVSSDVENQWQHLDKMSKQFFTLRLEEGTLNVYENLVRYSWLLTVAYNEMTASSRAVTNRISSLGFSVGQPQPVGRAGKQIIIPPNTIR